MNKAESSFLVGLVRKHRERVATLNFLCIQIKKILVRPLNPNEFYKQCNKPRLPFNILSSQVLHRLTLANAHLSHHGKSVVLRKPTLLCTFRGY